MFNSAEVDEKDNEILKEKSVGHIISSILKSVEETGGLSKKDSQAQLVAGKKLMNSTKYDLSKVRSILGAADLQYQKVADKLAGCILQCGIYYYNNTDEDDAIRIDKALELQGYALKIAVGKLMKDRCAENCKILEEKKKSLPPKEVKQYYEQIAQQIAVLKSNHYITFADILHLLKQTVKPIVSIKEVLGANHDFYKEACTLVARVALSEEIDLLNKTQEDQLEKLNEMSSRDYAIEMLKNAFHDSWEILNWIDHMDITLDFRNNRLEPNKSALKNTLDEIGAFGYDFMSFAIRGRTSVFCGCAEYISFDHDTYKTEQEIFDGCSSSNNYYNYIKKYPNGKYVEIAKKRTAEIAAEKKRKDEEIKKNATAVIAQELPKAHDLTKCLELYRKYRYVSVDLSSVSQKILLFCVSKEDCKKAIDTLNSSDPNYLRAKKKLDKYCKWDDVDFSLSRDWYLILLIHIIWGFFAINGDGFWFGFLICLVGWAVYINFIILIAFIYLRNKIAQLFI